MNRAYRYGLPAVFLCLGLSACGGSSDDNAAASGSAVRPDIGSAATRSADLMTTDNGAAAAAAAVRLFDALKDLSSNPAGLANQFVNQASNRSASSGTPGQRASASCSGGGSVNADSDGRVIIGDFSNCRSVSDNPPRTDEFITDGRLIVDCRPGSLNDCPSGGVAFGQNTTALLANAKRTESGTVTQHISTQVLGSTRFTRQNAGTPGETATSLQGAKITVDIQDLLDGTQLTLETNPGAATDFIITAVTDDNNALLRGGLAGTYAVGNSTNCQDGVLSVETTAGMPLVFNNNEIVGGQLVFTNAASEMAEADFQANGDIIINAGGASQTYTESEIAALCQF